MYSKSTVHLAHLAQHIVFAATTANATGANFHSLFIQQPVDFRDALLQYDLTGCLQVQIETELNLRTFSGLAYINRR